MQLSSPADPWAIAPRVHLYPQGAVAPVPAPGWIALAQIAQSTRDARVFGDGSHATTRLCAAAVDLLCRQRRPEAVLDVGTGTGVLARIARARGARRVVATDIDPVALTCARANCALDTYPIPIELTTAAPDYWGASFDLVVANILEEPLHLLAPALTGALAPAGVLLISGFTHLQAPALRVQYERHALMSRRHCAAAEWVLLEFTSMRST